MFLLMAWHGFRVRRDGGISRPLRDPGAPPLETTDRTAVVRGEVLTIFLTIASIVLLSTFIDPPIGPAAEPGALVEHTKAPWVFLWIQELLRVWPPAVAGVLTPLVVVLLLALLPYMDWKNTGVAVWFNRQGRVAQVAFIGLFLLILGLTIRAAIR
jgi:quinol-cytochrome oxidoreductase complex cytochrome b subunit